MQQTIIGGRAAQRRNGLHDNRAMVTNTDNPWGLRLTTLMLWLLAAASVVYWGLRWSTPAGGLAVPAVFASPPAPDVQAMARLLGAGAVASPTAPVASRSSRFALVGVLAGRQSGGGAALIAIDGQPARPFRLGATVDVDLVLQSVGQSQVQLGASRDGPAALTLQIPQTP